MQFKRFLLVPALVAGFAMSSAASAALVNGVGIGAFAGATVETFNYGSWVQANSYNFGNGLGYYNLVGESDLISYTGGYGMGNAPFINGGKDGDGYFGTYLTPTSFALTFAGGTNYFGFYGAESDVSEIGGRDAVLVMNFYDAGNNLIGSINESTPNNVHAWDQFHGFYSDVAISRVEFLGAGHMVMDNVQFAPVPEPETYAMMATGLGLMGFAARRRKQKAA